MGGKLLVVTAFAAIFTLNGADVTTPETTCKAAAARDKRVNYGFCVSQLRARNDTAGADTWGLAKAAARIAGATEADIEARLGDPGTDPKTKGALGECMMLYHREMNVFGLAEGEIDRRDYAAGKRRVAEVPSLARYCDEYFANAGVRSPFTKRGAECEQVAIICAAIFYLILAENVRKFRLRLPGTNKKCMGFVLSFRDLLD